MDTKAEANFTETAFDDQIKGKSPNYFQKQMYQNPDNMTPVPQVAPAPTSAPAPVPTMNNRPSKFSHIGQKEMVIVGVTIALIILVVVLCIVC